MASCRRSIAKIPQSCAVELSYCLAGAGCFGTTRAYLPSMNDSRTMTEGQKIGEMGNGKRTAIIGTAVVVVGALIGILAVGFHGRHIARNADAMATPVGVPTGPTNSAPHP
jgi:hypothetical protein